MFDDFGLYDVIQLLGMPAVVMVSWGLWALKNFINSKTENDFLRQLAAGFERTVVQIVMELNQTWVDAVKAARDPGSPGGSVLTDAEKQQIRRQAVQKLKDYFGLGNLMRIFSYFTGSAGTEQELNSFLETKIESAVVAVKAAKKNGASPLAVLPGGPTPS